MFESIDVFNVLKQTAVSTKAPCRVDLGGFWDAKATALINGYVMPRTVNIALDLPLTVTLRPFTQGRIKVTSGGYHEENYEAANAPFNTRFALVFAICRFFRVSGIHVQIASAFPPQSGLGGSGVLAIALVHSISRVLNAIGVGSVLSLKDMVRLAHDIEDGLRLSFTGLQDQAAAAHGGANLWNWHYENPEVLYEQMPIWNPTQIEHVNGHLLVAYTGAAHSSNDANLTTLECFLSGRQRTEWESINDLTLEFANALADLDWASAVSIMREELDIRRRITPHTLTDHMLRFVTVANEFLCAARFAGAGGGGCVWAIGELDHIRRLKRAWSELASHIPGASLLDTSVSRQGVVSDKWISEL